LVTVLRVKLPPVLTIVTFAPAMAAPDLSVTVPLTRLLVCAPAIPGKSRRATRASPAKREGKWQSLKSDGGSSR